MDNNKESKSLHPNWSKFEVVRKTQRRKREHKPKVSRYAASLNRRPPTATELIRCHESMMEQLVWDVIEIWIKNSIGSSPSNYQLILWTEKNGVSSQHPMQIRLKPGVTHLSAPQRKRIAALIRQNLSNEGYCDLCMKIK